MKRVLMWSSFLGVALVALCLLGIPASDEGVPAVFVMAASNMRQVGIAARLYADDHQGLLPESLNELTPKYLLNKEPVLHLHFATSKARLSNLPSSTVILFCMATDKRSHQTRLMMMHPDTSVE